MLCKRRNRVKGGRGEGSQGNSRTSWGGRERPRADPPGLRQSGERGLNEIQRTKKATTRETTRNWVLYSFPSKENKSKRWRGKLVQKKATSLIISSGDFQGHCRCHFTFFCFLPLGLPAASLSLAHCLLLRGRVD